MSDIPITSISEAFNKVSGDPVHRIQGKLIKIGKPRQHNGENGVVIYQDANLAGPDGKEIIKVKFGRSEEIQQTYSGQLVEISCYKSDKHGWVGVKVEDESYTNSTGKLVENRVLKVSKTANIELLSSGPAPAAPRAAAAKPAPRAAQPPATRPTQQQQSASNGDPLIELQRKARKIATALDVCLTCAGWLADKHNLRPEDVRAIAVSMSIRLEATTDYNALPGYDPRKQDAAPPPPSRPAPPAAEEPPMEDEEDNVPF